MDDLFRPGSQPKSEVYESDYSDHPSGDSDSESTNSGVEEEEEEEDTLAGIEEEDIPNIFAMTRDARENLNSDELFLKAMLELDCNYEYAEKDLENEMVLDRAIDLLHHKRQGQDQRVVTRVLGLHITYDALSDEMKRKAKIEEQFALKAEGKKRLEQKKQAMKRLNVNWAKASSVRGEKS